jgi:hypothetical protein
VRKLTQPAVILQAAGLHNAARFVSYGFDLGQLISKEMLPIA